MPHLWLRVAIAFYGIGLLYALSALVLRKSVAGRIMLPAVGLGAIFHFVSLAETLVAEGRLGSFASPQVASWLALLLMVFFFAIYWRYGTASHGTIIVPLVFLLSLSAALAVEPPRFSSPLMRSGWIYSHVALIFIGYAALLVSFSSSILYLLQERSLKSKLPDGLLSRLPALAVMDDIGLRSLVFGFPFMTLGLIAGSVIAQEAFGATFFRDPKVGLSLLMWAVYMLLLFTRWTAGWRGRRAATLSAIAFLAATLAWGATYVGSMHQMVEH
jgi:ABC-type uncharacterized transport system permease subunit